MILLPAETLSRKQNQADSLGRKLFFKGSNLGRKQEIANCLIGSQILWTVSGQRENLRTSLYPVIRDNFFRGIE